MRVTYTIFKKEFKTYFALPIAYVYISLFLILSGWLYFKFLFVNNFVEMRSYFSLFPITFLFLVPVITMRLWSEEKKMNTIELLMTLPVSDYEVVLGKFFASFAFLVFTIVLSFTIPVTLFWTGNPDPGPIIGGYLGSILLGGAYLAIGLFASSLTKNQIVAFIIGFAICFGFFIVGEEIVLSAVPQSVVPFLTFMSTTSHFQALSRGVIDTRDVIYYLSVMIFFLFLNLRSIEGRKWN